MQSRRVSLFAVLAVLCFADPILAFENTSDVVSLQSAATSAVDGMVLPADKYGSVAIELTISASATVTWEGSTHTTFSAIPCANKATGVSAITATATGLYKCDIAGLSSFRARISSYGSGTVTAVARASTAVSGAVFGFDADGLRVSLATLLACEDQVNDLCMVSGAAVRQSIVISGVITNATSTATTIFTGAKTLYGQIVCSAAVTCTQTQAVYGDINNDAANGVLLCTLTLSGTTRAQDACPVITANFSNYYVVTTATSGTDATGAVYAMY